MLNFFLTFQTTAFLIPFQIDNDTLTQSIYAVIATFLFVIIALLIILAMREEEITGYTSKILRKIKIKTHTFWKHRKKYKKSLKIISYIALASFIMYLEYNLAHRAIIIITEHSTITQELQNELNATTKNEKFSKINSLRNELFLCISGIIISAPLALVPFIKNIKSKLENHILRTFVATVIFGGFFSFFIPVLLYQNNFIGDTKDLTTALLGVTGGVVALFSLIKSHQKSELEREQLEVQKQKDSRDHIRQLYNSYSDRFDKAVTELNDKNDKNAAFAAVYKLSHLADDWLDFKDLANTEKDFQKLKDKANAEVQTIINVFCKYIRSMPDGYTHSRLKDGDIPAEDTEIRRLIFSEISSRCSKVGHDSICSRGQWSDFDFDFSYAPIFYSLAELTFDDANFSHATFYKDSSFKEAKFARNAIFEDAIFTKNADFFAAKFIQSPSFDKAYISNSNFNSFFFRGATFEDTKFISSAIFDGAEFTGIASFHGATFGYAEEGYDHKFTAHFNETKFCGPTVFEHAKFSGTIDFSEAEFKTIHDSRYDISNLSCDIGSVSFYNALFFGKIFFNYSYFDVWCEFINARFFDNLSFRKTNFKYSPIFDNSYFSHRITYNFKNIDPDSLSKISTNSTSIILRNGKIFTQSIPKRSCIFDTETWDEEKNTTSCVSPPA